MFVGAIPKPCVEQALRILPVGDSDVFVCCSGSFRLEQGLAAKFPNARVHSNDVSLLTTAYGKAATGQPLEFRFIDRLERFEAAIAELGDTPTTRLGALSCAVRMGT